MEMQASVRRELVKQRVDVIFLMVIR